jgi:hypothetical protein
MKRKLVLSLGEIGLILGVLAFGVWRPAAARPAPASDTPAGQVFLPSTATLPAGAIPYQGVNEALTGQATPGGTESAWTTLMTETFEGVFPSGLWNVFDFNGATNGEYFWDDTSFKANTGSWSAWAARGGANGLNPSTSNYANNMDSWMVYGPFDLSGCASAHVDFSYWNKSEANYDFLSWYASGDGTGFGGYSTSGDSQGWKPVVFDLGGYLGDPTVWLAFKFSSDSSVTDSGPFIDDIHVDCYIDTTVVSWTFMVYQDGDNNLEGAALVDFMEMSGVGSTASVDIVVQLDRIPGESTSYDDWTGTRRYYVAAGVEPRITNGIDLGEANMGDPETFKNFVRWAKAAYPANHYAVIVWNHGAGWERPEPGEETSDPSGMDGVAYDDTDNDHLTMPELDNALNSLTGTGSTPIDLLGFDACLMAMIEVDNQVRPYAGVRVGSEAVEPGSGWDYDATLTGLTANPGWTASQLGTRIVDDYYTSITDEHTQSAVNLGSSYDTLNTAVHNFANALISNGPYYRTELAATRAASTEFVHHHAGGESTDYIDLWDFAFTVDIQHLNAEVDAAALAVQSAVVGARIHEHHGPFYSWVHGTSIYFPDTLGEYDARYDGSSGFLRFTAGTNWDEWLRAFYALPNYPATFSKTAPSDGATGQVTSSLILDWATSSGATSYDYCYDTSNNDTCNTSWTNTTSSSATISGLSVGTTYYWQVRAKNATGTLYADNRVWWSFSTGSGPGAFNKTSPANGATGQGPTTTVHWGSSSGATSYQYCYDTTNDNACSNWISNGIATDVSLTNLAASTTYYWHVKALNTYGTTYSNGSSTAFWNFTTAAGPGAFVKSSPANGATDQSVFPTLSWSASSGVSSYSYCYDTTNDNACSNWTINHSATSAVIGQLNPNTTYYWQVKAVNVHGTTYANGAETAFWSFTTAAGPAAFGKTAPANTATGLPSSVTLSWEASPGASEYEFCYDTTNDNACSSTWYLIGNEVSWEISGLSPNTTYYWQVRANNSYGTTYANGSLSAFWRFTTGGVPGAFNKTSPANGTTGVGLPPTLGWGASNGTDGYYVCIDTSNDNVCTGGWFSSLGSTGVVYPNAIANTTYYWQVRATNSFGTTYANGSSTTFWSFTTAASAPGVFGKTAPANGATGMSTSPTLTWENSPGVTQYFYCYDTTNDNTCSQMYSTGTSPGVMLSGLTPGTTYYWQVQAENSYGITYANGAWSAFWSFTTAGTAPGAFSKSAPANGATGVALNPTLSWAVSSGATSYETCYDSTNDNDCPGGWTSNGGSTSVGLSGLNANTEYFWHVRAKNATGTTYAEGNATAYWKFTTGSPPGAFSKSNPSDGAIGVSTSPTLSWAASSAATGYEVCYDTTNDSACTGTWLSSGTNLSVGLSGLTPATVYYWQVRANNGLGTVYANGASTAFWSFTTSSQSPGAFGKLDPSNGATSVTTSPTLSWAASNGATSYEYCVDTTNDNACTSTWVSSGATPNASLSGLSPATAYSWQVRANNGSGTTYADGSATSFWTFSTAGEIPGSFVLTSPSYGATGVSTSPTLSWGTSSGANYYEYCIDTTNDMACSGWTNNGTTTTAALSGLSPVTTYYWHVRAVNAVGVRYAAGNMNSYWNFTTGNSPPGAFSRISPPHQSINQSLSLTLTWGTASGASSYEYCYDAMNDNACGSSWVNVGTATSAQIDSLSPGWTYYWHVRAINSAGTTYAGGVSTNFWSFTTGQGDFVHLTFSPQMQTVNLDQEFDLAIQVATTVKQVDGVAAFLNFDPAYLEVVSLIPGTTLPSIITNSYNNTSGTINFSAMTSSNFPSGTFTIATLRMRAKAETVSTYIQFNEVAPRLSDVTFGGSSILDSCMTGEVVVDPGVKIFLPFVNRQ